MRKSLVVPVVAGVLAALGIALAAGSVVAVSSALNDPAEPSVPVPQSVSAPTSTIPTGEPAVEAAGIAGLADQEWVSRLAAQTGIPERALAAYTGATLVAAEELPACGLGWNTLAGIGEVESHHGTIHGSSIDADGVARPDIIGIPLDGVSTMAIPDTDGGALDGDLEWDRAIGPLQFIPTTWELYGRDGNGDGVADPHQIDDAALTAAVYLCEAGGDLTAAEGWIAAIAAYNDDVVYNNRVAAAAEHYASSDGM